MGGWVSGSLDRLSYFTVLHVKDVWRVGEWMDKIWKVRTAMSLRPIPLVAPDAALDTTSVRPLSQMW